MVRRRWRVGLGVALVLAVLCLLGVDVDRRTADRWWNQSLATIDCDVSGPGPLNDPSSAVVIAAAPVPNRHAVPGEGRDFPGEPPLRRATVRWSVLDRPSSDTAELATPTGEIEVLTDEEMLFGLFEEQRLGAELHLVLSRHERSGETTIDLAVSLRPDGAAVMRSPCFHGTSDNFFDRRAAASGISPADLARQALRDPVAFDAAGTTTTDAPR